MDDRRYHQPSLSVEADGGMETPRATAAATVTPPSEPRLFPRLESEPSPDSLEPGTVYGTALDPDPGTGLFPSQHWANIPPPTPRDDDIDSGFGDSASDRMSLNSTIMQYRTINGRTYHSERGNAQYWVSNDEPSNEALDINHHVLTLLQGGRLYQAPLSQDIEKAADIGTGTGIWAIDFADEFPGAEVVGTDLSPIQPDWIPANLHFQIDDCTQTWGFGRNSLDYVHIRLLVGSIVDWSAMFVQAYNALKPGGWVESLEASPFIRSDDGTVKEGSAMQQWGPVFLEGGERTGRTFSVLEDDLQRKGVLAAGFVDVHQADYKVPIGPWARNPVLREAGRFFQAAVLQDIEGTLTFVADVLGWSEAEIASFGAHYRSEITDGKVHGYFSQRRVWAMKPMEGGEPMTT